MRKTLFLALFFLSPFLANAQKLTIQQFSFLSGNWEMKTSSGKTTEHWKLDKESLRGASYKHNTNGDSTLTETVVLKKIEGKWNYCVTGYEKGNEGTTNFELISNKDNTFIFENLKHDFPSRIVYQPKSADSLLAWIEGTINGKQHKVQFPYQRRK
ncbi:MAG: hypothetical protein EOO90_01515 [Pedobacter sp.]|nr:MAG: hypothetical protein EOO90_01515 [Pedobacter sp.]